MKPPQKAGEFMLGVFGPYSGTGPQKLKSICRNIVKTTGLSAVRAIDLYPLSRKAKDEEKFLGSLVLTNKASAGLFVVFKPKTLGVHESELMRSIQSIAYEAGRMQTLGKPTALICERGTQELISSIFKGACWDDTAEEDFEKKQNFYNLVTSLTLTLYELCRTKESG